MLAVLGHDLRTPPLSALHVTYVDAQPHLTNDQKRMLLYMSEPLIMNM